MTTSTRCRYAGHRFPAEIISPTIWLHFRFPLKLRPVEEMLTARGIIVSRETVRRIRTPAPMLRWSVRSHRGDRS